MEKVEEQLETHIKVGVGSFVAFLTLVAIIILQHNLAFAKDGTIVLPAGGTYLGPSSTPTNPPEAQAAAPEPQTTPTPDQPKDASAEVESEDGKFTVAADAPWVTKRGNTYSYFFKAPAALKLVTFPNDKYDIYAISWKGFTPESNVLVGVDNLKNNENNKKYVDVSKRLYVEEWWKQFGGLKGVASITSFTNSQGLKGYKAKYLNGANQSPNDDIFFEVPGHPEYVIHLANGVLSKPVFDKIVDSVGWAK